MRIVIVGSRNYPKLDLVRECIHRLAEWSERTGEPLVIVSGTEPVKGKVGGVDEAAISEARKCGIGTFVYPADWSLGKRAGPMRNTTIISDADAVVAFIVLVDGVGSRGTSDSVRKSLERGNLRKVVNQDGTALSDEEIGEFLRMTLGE